METAEDRVGRFLTVCTELVGGKFSDAESKIAEALKAIATSKELTELFTAVTENFDYTGAKRTCLREPAYEGAKGEMYLPAGRREILAFVFCLFVEIDAGAVKLNDFLLKYCYVDGSYTASYAMFAERVVRPFCDIVADCFPEAKREARERGGMRAKIFQLAELFAGEKTRLSSFGLRDEDRAAAESLIAAIMSALHRGEREELPALLTGYRYFLRYVGGENENSAAIFELAKGL